MSRRNSIRERRPGRLPQRPLVYIATEAERTEPEYFDALFRSGKYRLVHVYDSDPKRAVEALTHQLRIDGKREQDSYWVVLDTDGRPAELFDQVAALCHSRGYKLIVSNVCFELWLLMHQENPSTAPAANCADYEPRLRASVDGYKGKNDYDQAALLDKVDIAIANARRRDTSPDAPWPRQEGVTRVYRLVEYLQRLKNPDA